MLVTVSIKVSSRYLIETRIPMTIPLKKGKKEMKETFNNLQTDLEDLGTELPGFTLF